ncbi:MAG: ABC transporter substrate-binding protein [Acidobacteriota bacterium]
MRRVPLAALTLAALALFPSAPDPLGDAVGHRITVVLSRDIRPYRQVLQGLRRSFHRDDPQMEYRVVTLGRDDSLAAEALPARGADQIPLIVAVGSRALASVRRAGAKVPVLLVGVPAPGQARSGDGAAEIFGVNMGIPFEKQFRALRAVAPRTRTVGVLYERSNHALIRMASRAAGRAGLTLNPVEIRSLEEIPGALDALLDEVNALWALPDATVFSSDTAPYIILRTLRQRVPFMGFSQSFVKAGSLLSLYCDLEDVGEQAGHMALDVLHGRRPARGGIEPPRKTLLALNLRVAEVIGLPIPPEIRRSADATYE